MSLQGAPRRPAEPSVRDGDGESTESPPTDSPPTDGVLGTILAGIRHHRRTWTRRYVAMRLEARRR